MTHVSNATDAAGRSGADRLDESQRALFFRYLLGLGDTDLILAQRLCQWCARCPTLEEDIALLNIALDLLGRARSLLGYAGEVEGRGRDEDRLAYFRDAADWRNVLLVEQPNGDFADTIARQFFYDAYSAPLYRELSRSADTTLAAIAAKAVKESLYHRRHSAAWLIRLGDGTDESARRAQRAVDALWPYTGELFASDPDLNTLLDAGLAADPRTLRADWSEAVEQVLDDATLNRPDDAWMHDGGRRGVHSEHLDYLLTEMQVLARAHPDARW